MLEKSVAFDVLKHSLELNVNMFFFIVIKMRRAV